MPFFFVGKLISDLTLLCSFVPSSKRILSMMTFMARPHQKVHCNSFEVALPMPNDAFKPTAEKVCRSNQALPDDGCLKRR